MEGGAQGRLGPRDVDSLIKSLHDRGPAPAATPSGEADRCRERGNDRFRAGAWQEAVDAYTASLEAAPSAAAHANRAMALLKLLDYAGAEDDATAALELDQNYVKAWLRRGAARRGLGAAAAAVEDFEAALRLEPGNRAAAEERRAAVAAWASAAGVLPPAPARVPVRLAASGKKAESETLLAQVETKRIPGGGAQRPGAATVQAAADEEEEVLPPLQAPVAVQTAAPMVVDSHSPSVKSPEPVPTSSTAPSTTAAAAAAVRLSSLRPPRTGMDFERAWRGLKSDVDQQAAYLALIDPGQMPTLLKQALTPALLAALVTAVLGPLRAADPARAAGILESLPQTPRFAMNALSLSAAQRGALGAAWAAAPEMASLRAPYGV